MEFSWLSAHIPINVNRALCKKSKSSGSINQVATDSWNQLQYQLLAFQSRGNSIWTTPLLYEYSFNKSCCPMDCRFWCAKLNSQRTHRFPLACQYQQHTFFIFYFFPALNLSFKFSPLFCMLFLYTTLLMQNIYLQIMKCNFSCYAYFAKVPQMNTLCST
jgi:hypothetical protein